MTGEQMKAWRELMRLGMGEAATALGVARNTSQGYEDNLRIPRHVALACRCIANGWQPWGEYNETKPLVRITN